MYTLHIHELILIVLDQVTNTHIHTTIKHVIIII